MPYVVIDHELANALGGTAVLDISLALVALGRADQAWTLLRDAEQLGSMVQVAEGIHEKTRDLADSKAVTAHLMAPFGALIGAEIAKGSETGDGLRQSMPLWCQQELPFLEGMAATLGAARLVELATSGNALEFWRGGFTSSKAIKLRTAIEMLPVFLEECLKSAGAHIEAGPTKGMRGSALLALASWGDIALMERAIDCLMGMGLSVEACLSTRWIDPSQRHLRDSMRANNALAEALAAGQAPMARLILRHAPCLDPMAEAKRVQKICSALADTDEPSRRGQHMEVAAVAMAVAEAIELGLSAGSPTKQRSAKPSL